MDQTRLNAPNWSELDYSGLKWSRLNQTEMDQSRPNRLNWTEVDRHGPNALKLIKSIKMDRNAMLISVTLLFLNII